MSDLARRLAEDKALRDAALQLFKSDLALVREDLDGRGIGERAKDRIGEAALGMIDDAVDYTENNKGLVAAGTAALVLWFARKPILHWLAGLLDGDEDAEPAAADSRSDTDSSGDLQ